MSRKPNTESRRAEIVAAMLPVLARHGYEKATVQAIAEQAGLAPGLIHYHFKSKQAILVSLTDLLAAQAQARFAEVAASGRPPGERLRAYLQWRLGLGKAASADHVAAWVMTAAEAVRQPEVRQVYQQAMATELQSLGGLLAECLAERQRDTRGVKALAAGLIALMEGAFLLSCAAPGVMPVGYAAAAAIAYVASRIEQAQPAKPGRVR